VDELYRRLHPDNVGSLPDHVLKDYVKVLWQFTERADTKEREAREKSEEGFSLLESLDGLPADRAAELIVGETDRLAKLHETYVARLQVLVGEDEAYQLLLEYAKQKET
jgi:FMN phosphatase YigB (HAD superfamily)